MSAPNRFELGRFERVDASPATALLRVSGSWAAGTPAAAPELLVAGGARTERVAALPDPAGAAADPWRAAYPVATALLDAPGTWFALVLDDGAAVSLPGLDQARVEVELAAAQREIAQLVVRAERAELRLGRAGGVTAGRERLREAEARRDAAESRVTRLEAALVEARRAGNRPAPPRDSDSAEVEAELARTRRRAEELGERLAATRRELEDATERFHGESEARQRAESRAGTPARESDGDEAPDAGDLRARLAALQRENADLRERVLEERRTAELTADRYRQEVEARMRAEGRARDAEEARDSLLATRPGDPA